MSLTIASLEFVIPRRWYLIIVDVSAICGFKINNERSGDWGSDVNMSTELIQDETDFMTPFEPPNSSFSCTCRSNIDGMRTWQCSVRNGCSHCMTACCFEHDGWSTGMSATALSRPIRYALCRCICNNSRAYSETGLYPCQMKKLTDLFTAFKDV